MLPEELRRQAPGDANRRHPGLVGEVRWRVVITSSLRSYALCSPVNAFARRTPVSALVAQGIEHRPPEPGAQVRILPGAPGSSLEYRLRVGIG